MRNQLSLPPRTPPNVFERFAGSDVLSYPDRAQEALQRRLPSDCGSLLRDERIIGVGIGDRPGAATRSEYERTDGGGSDECKTILSYINVLHYK